jgi:hypothetical protein
LTTGKEFVGQFIYRLKFQKTLRGAQQEEGEKRNCGLQGATKIE